jgi:fructosamine-3-kinase
MDREAIKTVLKEVILDATGEKFTNIDLMPVGGGSINECSGVVADDHYRFFLKQNSAKKFPHLFEKEKKGLEYLASFNFIRVPLVVKTLEHDGQQLLLMEYIREGNRTAGFWRKFGEQLALLHQQSSKKFGFHEDNYMGSLHQANQEEENWIDFFKRHRLQPQLELANSKGYYILNDPFHKLYQKLDNFFDPEPPALLHGDLWGGNFLCDETQNPVLIDPAVYYGHRSVDLAMSTLFGGFDNEFYSTYNYHFPLPANHEEQWEVCNLYPLLVHLNLFGRSYLARIENILRKYS